VDAEAFIRWALAETRTVDERYTVELLVELGLIYWNRKRKIYRSESLDEIVARSRERKLNPAYEPHYSEDDLRGAVEHLAVIKDWSPRSPRAIRTLEVLRFLPSLESVSLPFDEPDDISPLADLPKLRALTLGYPGTDRYNRSCADYTPLARCTALRELVLSFGLRRPDLTSLGSLSQLETLSLSGNLLVIPRGVSFPNVRRGALHCLPLPARDMAHLPHFPACEFLTLSGAAKLDGIEKMPRLRNLTIRGPFESFAPLKPLQELTWLTVACDSHTDPEMQPRDISPLARLPTLHYFKIGPEHTYLDMPRDYSPFTEAPALRELVIQRRPPVEIEVAAINAGLPPWDDLFLTAEPRTMPPLRMIMAPHQKHPMRREPHLSPGESGPIDIGMRQCEERWVGAYIERVVSERIGHSDWGNVRVSGEYHSFDLTIDSFEVVERLPEILDAARTAMAHLRAEYVGAFAIHLKTGSPEPTPAQEELDAQLQQRRDEWEYEQHQREQAEYLERLHQLELKKQQGAEIDPAEFSPSEQPPYPQREDIQPPADEEKSDYNFNVDDNDDGDIAVKTDPDPPPSLFDDNGHPLAGNYRLAGTLLLGEAWFYSHFRGIAIYIMKREPDLEIPEEKKSAP
jgi:hypothetical protein